MEQTEESLQLEGNFFGMRIIVKRVSRSEIFAAYMDLLYKYLFWRIFKGIINYFF